MIDRIITVVFDWLKKRNWSLIFNFLSSLSVIVALVIFGVTQKYDHDRFVDNLKIINCLNLKKAEWYTSGAGQPWDYNIRYNTSFYHQNWSDISKNLNYASSTIKYSSPTMSGYLNLANIMDQSNIIIERSELYLPFYDNPVKRRGDVLSALATSSKDIKNLYRQYGITTEYCENEILNKVK